MTLMEADRILIFLMIYQLPLLALMVFFSGVSTSKPKKLLSWFFLTSWIYYAALGVFYLGWIYSGIFLYYLFVPALLAICPLFYLYVKSLTTENFAVRRADALHFLPAAAGLGMNVLLYSLLDFDDKKWFLIYGFTHTTENLMITLNIYFWYVWDIAVLPAQILLYFYLTIKAIIGHRKDMGQFFSNFKLKRLTWIIWGTVSFFILLTVNNVFIQTDAVDEPKVRIVYNLIMLFFTAFLAFSGIRQTDIYEDVSKLSFVAEAGAADSAIRQQKDTVIACCDAKASTKKYQSPVISENEEVAILASLDDYMQSKKVFLDPQLKITDLSRYTKLPRRHISQAINNKLGLNFYQYVNRFRIKEAQRLMAEDGFSRYSMAGIASQAGFNSRSSFYTAFKDQTGCTPAKFNKGQLTS